MEPLDPDTQLGYLLVRAAREVSRSWLAAVRRHGINPGQFSTLAILAREPTLSQGELARRVMVTPQGMSESIGGLVAAGLLTRDDVEPGRAARLDVTAEGKALLRNAYPVVKAADEACFTALSPLEQQRLTGLLRKLLVGSPPADTTADPSRARDARPEPKGRLKR